MKRELKVAVTHDVDRTYKSYHYLSKLIRSLIRFDFKSMKTQFGTIFTRENTYWNFEDILKLEDNYNIKATYFFINESIDFKLLKPSNWVLSLGRYNIESKKVQAIINKVSFLGHEIGVHGSYNSYMDLNLLKKEKSILERICGKEIIGIRQHHLNRNDTTWQLQYKAGFKYDSSLGFNENIGYHESRIKPFAPLSNEFKVFPLALMDFTFDNQPNKWMRLEEIIQQTIDNEGVLVLNWHTDTFNPKEFKNHKIDFIRIIEILRSKDAQFATLKEFYLNSTE